MSSTSALTLEPMALGHTGDNHTSVPRARSLASAGLGSEDYGMTCCTQSKCMCAGKLHEPCVPRCLHLENKDNYNDLPI